MADTLENKFKEASRDFFRTPGPAHLERALNILEKAAGYYRYAIGLAGLFSSGTNLKVGTALSPENAWHCMHDLTRTRAFTLGLHEATRQKIKEKGSVHILEAGSGPLAPASFMVASQFPASVVHFSLMDLHALSCATARMVVRKLNLGAHCKGIHQVNLLDPDLELGDPDIVLLEAMDSGLLQEPQLQIEANLLPKTKVGTIFLPEEIEVLAMAAKGEFLAEGGLFSEWTWNPSVSLDSPMEWNWRQREAIRVGAQPPDVLRVRGSYPGIPWENGRAYVRSSLRVFGVNKLEAEEDSALTKWRKIPKPIAGPNLPFSIDYLAGSGNYPQVIQP